MCVHSSAPPPPAYSQDCAARLHPGAVSRTRLFTSFRPRLRPWRNSVQNDSVLAPRSQAPAWERTCLGSSASQRRHLSGALVPDPHRRIRASKTVALPSRSLVARKRAGAEWHSPTHFVTSSSSTPTEFHGQHRPRKSFGNAERTAMFRNCPMSAFLSLRPKIRRKFPFRPRVELPRPAPKRQPAQTGSASRDVGSERSPVFHKAGSKGASTISPKSFFTHSSRAAAIEAGQRPCAICQPRAQKT